MDVCEEGIKTAHTYGPIGCVWYASESKSQPITKEFYNYSID